MRTSFNWLTVVLLLTIFLLVVPVLHSEIQDSRTELYFEEISDDRYYEVSEDRVKANVVIQNKDSKQDYRLSISYGNLSEFEHLSLEPGEKRIVKARFNYTVNRSLQASLDNGHSIEIVPE